MPANLPDVARLQPALDSLNIILKNTHFKDDVLASGEKIMLRIDYSIKIPVLVFRFPEPFYDFLQVLTPDTISGSKGGWLWQNKVIIKLVISDAVITDQLSSLSFDISKEEIERLRHSLDALKLLSKAEIQELEIDVHSNTNKFLI